MQQHLILTCLPPLAHLKEKQAISSTPLTTGLQIGDHTAIACRHLCTHAVQTDNAHPHKPQLAEIFLQAHPSLYPMGRSWDGSSDIEPDFGPTGEGIGKRRVAKKSFTWSCVAGLAVSEGPC